MTNEDYALLLDPAREVPGWWWNEYIVENHRQRFTGEVTYKGPRLAAYCKPHTHRGWMYGLGTSLPQPTP